MIYLIGIDTSSEQATVFLSAKNELIDVKTNLVQRTHAGFVHQAIHDICTQNNVPLCAIHAFAVVGGPGSYTGLRIGLACVKGLAFATQKPIIALNSLEIIHASCPKIATHEMRLVALDARRNECFGAMYNHLDEPVWLPHNLTLDDSLLNAFHPAIHYKIVGTGAHKIKAFFPQQAFELEHFSYHDFVYSFSLLSYLAFQHQDFQNIATLEPFYLKPTFITPSAKKTFL